LDHGNGKGLSTGGVRPAFKVQGVQFKQEEWFDAPEAGRKKSCAHYHLTAPQLQPNEIGQYPNIAAMIAHEQQSRYQMPHHSDGPWQ
jgi:hypothetical protein